MMIPGPMKRASARWAVMQRLQQLAARAIRTIRLVVKHTPGGVSGLMAWRSKYGGSIGDDVVREMADVVRDKAEEYTSVEYFTLHELRILDHPYSTRHPAGSAGIPDWLVSAHGGDYSRSWETTIATTPDGVRGLVINTSNVAQYMGGTNRMRPRPTLQAAYAHTTDERKRIFDRVKRRIKNAD